MRFAIFTELYAPSIGGQEAFFRGLSLALIERGHEIDVYCIGHEAGLTSKETLDGITVHRYPIDPLYKSPRFNFLKRNWRSAWRFSRFIANVAKRGEHDFYLLNQWPFLHTLTLPSSIRERSLLHWCEIRHSAIFRTAQAHLPKMVGMNAAISDTVGSQITEASGRAVMTLPSGLDLTRSEYKAREERRDIVVFGRVMEHKNVALALEAFEILHGDGYAGQLIIAGDGPDMAQLRERVAQSSARGAVVLRGFIEDEEKFRLLAGCEVLAMPSRREGFPHVISEAMCCGLPIVTAAFPENGTKDVVARYEVGVVTQTDAQSFADGIRSALGSWERFSQNGLATAATLDWGSIAARLEERLQGRQGDATS